MAAGNAEHNHHRNVLVIEDDLEINQLIGAYVEVAGFRYLAALNGGEAFSQVRDHHPCVVVLDLMLPDVSGWEICRRLKSDRETLDIPIIILTALDNEDSRKEGLRCGAVEYLTKPFNPDELLIALNKHAAYPQPQAQK